MVPVDLVQRQQAADSLDESDLMTCTVEARLACVCLCEGAASVEDRTVELRGYTPSLDTPYGPLSAWDTQRRPETVTR